MTWLRFLSKPEVGGVTAEFAILTPAFAALLALLISVGAQQARLQVVEQQLGSLERLIELGESREQVLAAASGYGLTLRISDSGELTCLTSNVLIRVFNTAISNQKLSVCGLPPGQ
jgi:hypothetical protein